MPDYMLKITPETRDWMEANPDAVEWYSVRLDPGPLMRSRYPSWPYLPEDMDEYHRLTQMLKDIRPGGSLARTHGHEKESVQQALDAVHTRFVEHQKAYRAKALAHNVPLIDAVKRRVVPAIQVIKGVSSVEVDYDTEIFGVGVEATAAAIREVAQIEEVAQIDAPITMPHATGLINSVPAIHALPDAVPVASGGYAAAVGVLDTGVGATTPATLTTAGNAIFIDGADWPADAGNPYDVERWPAPNPQTAAPAGHGTPVAGVIRGDFAGPGGAYHGVAPSATIYNARIYKRQSATKLDPAPPTRAKIEQAVDWVQQQAPQGVTALINYSNYSTAVAAEAGGTDPATRQYEEFVDWLSQTRDAFWVGIIGNDPEAVPPPWSTPRAPGGAYNGIAAAAYIDNGGTKPAEFSWWLDNPAFQGQQATEPPVRKPDITAPGVVTSCAITANYPTGYAEVAGTSFAAPHVAGAAALVYSVPGMVASGTNPLFVRTVLIHSTKASKDQTAGPHRLVGANLTEQWSNRWGWGVLDAEAAVAYAHLKPAFTYEGEVAQGQTVKLYLIGPNEKPPADSYHKLTLCWDRQFSGSSSSSAIALSQLNVECWRYENGAATVRTVDDPDSNRNTVYNTKMVRGFRIPRQAKATENKTTLEIRVIGHTVHPDIGGGTGRQSFVLACDWELETSPV